MHLKLYAAIILLFGAHVLQAQSKSSNITGVLKEEAGEPAAFVAVVLLNKDSAIVKTGVSEANGTFSFLQLSEGQYKIATSSVQFKPYTTPLFEVKAEETKSLGTISLSPSVTELKEVQVVGARQMVEIHPDKAVFNIQGTINSAGNDGMDLLSKAPGVLIDNNENLILMGKSGVIIYIDGKRSQLRGEDLTAMLRGLRSENIDAIEIITNPSSKYDAEGNAGIINIKMKRDANLGWNGTLVAGFSSDLHERYNTGLTLNNRGKKHNFFSSYSFYDNKGENQFHLDRRMNGFLIENRSIDVWNNKGHDVRIGSDFYLNKNHTVGILLNGTFTDRTNHANSRTPIKNDNDGTTDQILLAQNKQSFDTENKQVNLNYQYKGNKGSSLNIDIDYGDYTNIGGAYQPNVYYDASEENVVSQNANRNDRDTQISIESIKGDYETKLGKGVLGTGFKISYVKTDNELGFFNQEGSDFAFDSTRSNTFNYTERITAAYINYNTKLNDKFSITGGIRAEDTYSLGKLTSYVETTQDNRVKRNYLNVFPSAGITYTANPKNKLGLSYSRRIDRPNYQSLNPFEYKLDELTFTKGNPFLQPQYTNNYQLTYSWNSKLNVLMSYSITHDFSAQVLDTTGTKGSLLIPKNLADAKNVALNISYPFDLTDWWNMRGNINTYYVRYDALLNGVDFNLDVAAYNISFQNTFTLPKDFKAELSFWYASPSIWRGTIETSSMWSSVAGIRKSIWKSRGQLSVSLNDIFNTQRWYIHSNYGGMQVDGNGRFSFRRVIVGFSYNFGNQKMKASRNRKSGLEDEKSRLSDG